MKTYLKVLAGIVVLTLFSMNLKAAVSVNSSNNESQQLQLHQDVNTTLPKLASSENILARSKPKNAETVYELSILAASRNELTLARSLIEKAIHLNYSNLDYLAFATDIAFIAEEYDKAEEYQVMMLLVAQSTLGLDNLQVAVILDQLAAINIKQEYYEQAKYRLQESLQLREKVLDNNHLLIISSLNKLALLATSQQRPIIAETLLKRSLDIARRVSGSQHGNSALLLASLADFYQQEGRLKEAEVHYKEAISIWKKIPSDALDRMMSQNSLGKLLLKQQRFDDARLQFKQVLSLLKKHYKSGHPYIKQALENIDILDAEHERIIEKNLMYNELVRALTFQLTQYKPNTSPDQGSQNEH